MAKQSPLKELHESNGAVFIERDGWVLPLHFGDPVAEYEAVRSGSGLIDLGHRGIFTVQGPDAFPYLQGMISNDLRKLATGRGFYATVLNVQGKILADVRVLSTGELFILDLWEPLKDKILEHLNRYLVADEVEIHDLTGRHGVLSVQGRQSRAFLETFLDDHDLPAIEGEHRLCSAHGAEMRIVRWSRSTHEGYEMIIARGDTARIASELQHFSENCSPVWVGEAALELLRVEAGIPRYGIDFDDQYLLLETGMDHAVNFHKGCYLGQEVVERIRSRGHVNRKLTGLLLEGEESAEPRDAVVSDNREIGAVTSSIRSPALGRPIALAYLQRDYWIPGTSVAVKRDGRTISATVSSLPFVKPIS